MMSRNIWKKVGGSLFVLCTVIIFYIVLSLASVSGSAEVRKKSYPLYRRIPEIILSSGTGGWRTTLKINPDGSFEGEAMDSNLGETGEKNPYGTLYRCEFTGYFSAPSKVSEFEYLAKMEKLTCKTFQPKIEDGVKIVPMGPYGLENCKEIRIYLPGYYTQNLPEEFSEWLRLFHVNGALPNRLPVYGLYSAADSSGFWGYPKKEEIAKLIQKDVGGGYSLIETDWWDYTVEKGDYRLTVSREFDTNLNEYEKLSIRNKNNKVIFATTSYMDIRSILVGEKELYYIWNKTENQTNYLSKVDLTNGKKYDFGSKAAYPESFGLFLPQDSVQEQLYVNKSWIFITPVGDDRASDLCMVNIRTNEVKRIRDYIIQGVTLYYAEKDKKNKDSYQFYKTDLEWKDPKYIGKIKRTVDKKTELLGIDHIDNNAVYYYALDFKKGSKGEYGILKFRLKK